MANSMKRIAAVLMALAVSVSFLPGLGGTDNALAKSGKKTAKKPGIIKQLSAKWTGTDITVKWKKARNAKKYQVFVATKKKFKLKKTVKKTGYHFKGKSGKRYKIRVRGVNGNKTGKMSKTLTIKLRKAGSDQYQQQRKEQSRKGSRKITE